jgi:hypothetical protein
MSEARPHGGGCARREQWRATTTRCARARLVVRGDDEVRLWAMVASRRSRHEQGGEHRVGPPTVTGTASNEREIGLTFSQY